jgi:hypothetical protein
MEVIYEGRRLLAWGSATELEFQVYMIFQGSELLLLGLVVFGFSAHGSTRARKGILLHVFVVTNLCGSWFTFAGTDTAKRCTRCHCVTKLYSGRKSC